MRGPFHVVMNHDHYVAFVKSVCEFVLYGME